MMIKLDQYRIQFEGQFYLNHHAQTVEKIGFHRTNVRSSCFEKRKYSSNFNEEHKLYD